MKYWLLLMLTPAFACGCGGSTTKPNPPMNGRDGGIVPTAKVAIRLCNVTIPSGSRHRKNETLSNPPCVYVTLYENGKALHNSQVRKGWEVDFENMPENHWEIELDAATVYSLEVWDDQTYPYSNKQILAITDLKGANLESGLITETDDEQAPSRLTTIKFKQITKEEPSNPAPASK